MTGKFSDRTAIVTGGSKGIGEAIVRALAEEGANVAMNYGRDKSGALKVADSLSGCPGRVHPIQADISRAKDVEALFRITAEQIGPPDILVCNAGVSAVRPLVECDEELFNQVYGINVKGLMFCLRQAALNLKDNGRVVVIASSTAVAPPPGTLVYASSKAAAIKMAEIAAQELGPRGITVNAILPGLTDTPMISNLPDEWKQAVAQSSPFGRIGLPSDISALTLFLASEEAQWITGQAIVANGGAKR